jgi:hypothetical protein
MEGTRARHGMVAAIAVAVVALVSGCGSSAPDSHPRPVAAVASRADATRFLSLANHVCATVRHGMPAPADRGRLTRYARAAVAPTRRTIVSLQRMRAPSALRPRLHELIDAERDLQAAYAAIARRHEVTGGGLREREQVAATRASSVGLPGCAELRGP